MAFSLEDPKAVSVACIFFITGFIFITRLVYSSPLNQIPGPWYSKWTRLGLKWYIITGQRAEYIHSLHNKYGNFVRIAPREVAISDIDACKAIHRVGSGFNKSDWYLKFTQGSPGVFAMTDPKQHAARRRLFAQPFSNSSVLGYESIVRDKVGIATSKIKRDASAGCADILKWFTFMATDTSGELSFGKSFETLQSEKKSQYIHDLETTMMISGISAELETLVAFLGMLPIPALQNVLSLNSRLDDYGQQAIQRLRSHLVSDGGANSSKSIFTHMLKKSQSQDLSDKDIEREAANLIIAGSDTTAVTLTYTVWALLRPVNRAYKDKLIQELNAVAIDIGQSDSRPKISYLDAVIREGLRLYGAAPGSLPRVVPTGGAALGDYFFPEGTVVSTQAYTIHRNSTIYSEPESFNPERWFEPTKEMQDAFTAFGAGSRTCLGIHLAMCELRLSIATFFRECQLAEILPSTTDASMEFVNYFLIAPKGGKCEIRLPGDVSVS